MTIERIRDAMATCLSMKKNNLHRTSSCSIDFEMIEKQFLFIIMRNSLKGHYGNAIDFWMNAG